MKRVKKKENLAVCFMGGSQAGIVGALTLLSMGHRLIATVSYFKELTRIFNFFKVPVYLSTKDKSFTKALAHSDILISVHGREILDSEQLHLPKLGCINVHPYFYKYKGSRPVSKALKDRNFKGSVGVHRMEKDVDSGEIIVEEFVDTSGAKTVDEIYNRLYPYYSIALLKALDVVAGD